MTQAATNPDEVVTHARVRVVDLPDGAGRLGLITIDNDRDHTRPTTFGPAGLASIDAALDQVSAMTDLAAVAVTGKPFIFAVGADLSAIGLVDRRETIEEFGQLGHAVLRARHHVGDATFAVMLGDDLIDERDELLSKMLAENAASGLTVIALMEVDPDHIHLYGAAAVEPTDDPDVVRVTGLVEKPKKEDAPSNYAVIGRYVLTPGVFDILERTEPGKGGEIQLTDALQELAVTDGVLGVVFRGRRYDTGDRVDYIKAIVQLAADRDDLGPELRPWLKDFAEKL